MGTEGAWPDHHDHLPQGVVVRVLPRVPHDAVGAQDLSVFNGVSAALRCREKDEKSMEVSSENRSLKHHSDTVGRARKARHISGAPSGGGISGRMSHHQKASKHSVKRWLDACV